MEKRGRRRISSYEMRKLSLGIGLFLTISLLFGAFSFSTSSDGIITGNALFPDFSDEDFSFGGEGGFFDIWDSEKNPTDTSLIKWLMFFMVIMLIYWAVDGIVEGKGFLKFLFAGVVSYLSVNFIVIEEIYSIMTTYSALGVTFTVIIPFIIVLLFTTRLVSDKRLNLPKVFTQRVVWAAYTIFLVYYLWTSEQSSTAMNWLIIFIFITAAIISIFNKSFINYVRTWNRKINRMNTQSEIAELRESTAEGISRKETNDAVKKIEAEGRARKALEDAYGDINRE